MLTRNVDLRPVRHKLTGLNDPDANIGILR